MNVFFTTPFAGKSKYQKFIDAIVQEIDKENKVITPEDKSQYLSLLDKLQQQGLNKSQAHYAFIRQGIASADVVIIEASEEDIRVGHEMTLALLFHKPTLVLSQTQDFSDYITHDLLSGAKYKTEEEARSLVHTFIENSQITRVHSTMQTIDTSADSLHSIALSRLRQLAKQESGQFGDWARRSESEPEVVAREVKDKLGSIKVEPAWSVFAPIYNEDSPDYIQSGVAKFVSEVFKSYGIKKDDTIVEAACGTAALARQLLSLGHTKIKAFDVSRPMLSEAFRLSAHSGAIEIFESDINELKLLLDVPAMVWADYSSNFALDAKQLNSMIGSLLDNLLRDGILIFDIRTYQGWQVDFYSQPVTMFATEKFQRIWLNNQDHIGNTITFDVFIRLRDADGGWSDWRRESMVERMWSLQDVVSVVKSMDNVSLEAVYGDDFRKIDVSSEEPNLAYFVLRKTS